MTGNTSTLLAIDTSSPACSVALQHDGKIWQQFQPAARKHTQELLPLTETLLQQAGISKQEITGIIISKGPGAFTGLRIGAAVAMGLAAAWQVPLWPVSSLALLAASARRLTGEANIVALMDARMDEVYAGYFGDAPHDAGERVCPPEALPREWFDGALVAGSGTVYAARFPVRARLATTEIVPRAEDAFTLLPQLAPLPVGAGVELNYLRNEVTQK